MFERLTDAHQVERLILMTSKRPCYVGRILGWDLWAVDGKAYLFKGSRGRIADWFEFRQFVRQWCPTLLITAKGV